jgi:glycine/D-amino acid oxidase-like deaminating enzyme
MNLTSDFPYWLLRNGLQQTYPKLGENLQCECAVVGAGITGALLADRLALLGKDVIVIDRRDACTGSTSASTALLQYEIDVSLIELREKIGNEAADRAYRNSHDSIDQIESIAESLDEDVGFARRTSIYLADDRKSARRLALEARARQQLGLDVSYHNQQEVKSKFGLPGMGALSSRQAACCDPYRFANALLRRVTRSGGRVFDRTCVEKFIGNTASVEMLTDTGATIQAQHVIIANGYESQRMLREKIVDLHNTYALISEPLDSIEPWQRDWMLWETKVPYLYLRITADGRLLVGGEDDPYHSPAKRDRSISTKSKIIRQKVLNLLPQLPWEPAYEWAGTFGQTQDGLAYIGESPEYPNCYFALGFGGNGITFSTIATEIIPALIDGQTHPHADLYRFGR